MNKTINMIVAGPRGKMGREALALIERTEHFRLVGCIDRKNDGMNLRDLEGMPAFDAPIFTDATEAFDQVNADVLIELTNPHAGYHHAKQALIHHVRPVVGTSGFSTDQLQELEELSASNATGIVIAPNFAIGAILMMRFAKEAAKYFPDVEIIEKHHDNKLDAPSGTAVKTAQLIQEVREKHKQGHPDEIETIEGARGADVDGMKIHSMRLPGFIAQQEVVFGMSGQTLTINHNSADRASFMSGVEFAVNEVMNREDFVYGLENLME
ncbi:MULTISPECIES: 4-hydroxy-tetrahydrodipicolinate reductase [Allobacillus]|uniref:4-hydroxy-tetrahydrodipicolinate reductase n=1 Tax=Allobacillus salarius TaxID=1955272 RepID=A0A556PT45_9BACI|nr:4-hydroxy-tetrahydrodipicolinate reductase [Allobacillus salarius]TSJ67549.1 4-hydroxy-tetrahydrodipicolinate reductase [Allobacillus salarius]